MRIWTFMHAHWAMTALVAYHCPRNVRLLLDDDTEVPCRCEFIGLDPVKGLECWAVLPVSGTPVEMDRIIEMRGSVWASSALDMTDCVTTGFVCPVCAAVSHDPNDKREGYCPRCHQWTRKSA